MKISCASWIGRDSLNRYRKSKGIIKGFAEPSPFRPSAIHDYLPNA